MVSLINSIKHIDHTQSFSNLRRGRIPQLIICGQYCPNTKAKQGHYMERKLQTSILHEQKMRPVSMVMYFLNLIMWYIIDGELDLTRFEV